MLYIFYRGHPLRQNNTYFLIIQANSITGIPLETDNSGLQRISYTQAATLAVPPVYSFCIKKPPPNPSDGGLLPL